MVKVIFDRSVFHGRRYLAIASSPLRQLVETGKIQLMYTTAFIEETLMYSQKNPSDFLEHWRFLLSLNKAHWFSSPDRILQIELGRKAHRPDYYFLKESEYSKTAKMAIRLAHGAVPQAELAKAISQIKSNYEIRNTQKAQRFQLRKKYPQTKLVFADEFEHQVEGLIQNNLQHYYKYSSGYLKVWRQHRDELKFTELYLKSWFVPIFLSTNNHQVKIDKNDKSDAEQLAFLEWADVFVSDDKGLPPTAFSLMFPNKTKLFMDSDTFIQYLDKLYLQETPA